MGSNNVLLPLEGESVRCLLCSVIITHAVVCLFMQMVGGVLLLFRWLLAVITSYWCWCGVVATAAVTTARRHLTSSSPAIVVVLLYSWSPHTSYWILVSGSHFHDTKCLAQNDIHSVANSDFWVEIVFKSFALKWYSYPCFIASKMHPWYIQLKPQQSPHPSQRRWSMTLVLTLHFNVWRILEVSAKYRSRFFMILGVGGPTSVKALLQGAFNI